METILEFRLHEAALRKDRAALIADGGSAPVDVTYFIMPVRLKVAGMELFEWPEPAHERIVFLYDPENDTLVPSQQRSISSPSPWVGLPILHVATIGLETVQEVWQKGKLTYYLPEVGHHLELERFEMEIIVYSGVSGRSARVAYNELLHAFMQFASNVRKTLSKEVPELNEHSYFGNWLKQVG